MYHDRNKRSTKLVHARFQLKLAGVFVGIAAVALLIQLFLLGFDLRATADRLENPELLLSAIPHILGRSALFSAGMVIPITLGVGILVTHRVAGPVYRFEQYLASVARGEATEPCRIRDGDEFQELCDRINEAVAALSGLQEAKPDPADAEIENRFRKAA